MGSSGASRNLEGGWPSDSRSSSWSSMGLRARSRSPPRVALPGLRSDAPGRRERTPAQLPRVLDDAARQEALSALDRDVLAVTTNRTHAARMRTIEVALSLWGLALWPLTPTSMKALASTLKQGGYASAHLYLMAYKIEAERRGQVISEALRRNVLDYSRSCLRGLGAPARPKALPLEQLHLLPRGFDPWIGEGPINPRAMLMCGSWWMCRELELSSFRARLLEFERVAGVWKASMHLPASKTDLQAAGVSRSLMCTCSSSSRSFFPLRPLRPRCLRAGLCPPSAWCTCCLSTCSI